MNIDRYFICTGIGNLRLHSCLGQKNSFRIFVYFNTYEGTNEKRSIANKLRNGLESLRGAKINKKLETLKKNPVSYHPTGVYIYIHILV